MLSYYFFYYQLLFYFGYPNVIITCHIFQQRLKSKYSASDTGGQRYRNDLPVVKKNFRGRPVTAQPRRLWQSSAAACAVFPASADKP
jgi:hypothetical protein